MRARHLPALLLFACGIACSGWPLPPEPAPVPSPTPRPLPKPRPAKPQENPDKPDAHERSLRRLVKGIQKCRSSDRGRLCKILHKASAHALPSDEKVLYGVALTCFDPVRASWPSQVESAVKDGLRPRGAGVMGLQFEEGGEGVRLFTIDATSDDEIPGMDEGVKGVARCLESSCTAIELRDRSLFDYLHSEPRSVQTLKVDGRGHPVGRTKMPFALLHTNVDGQGWWVALEGEPSGDGPCQYVNLFPDVPVRSR